MVRTGRRGLLKSGFLWVAGLGSLRGEESFASLAPASMSDVKGSAPPFKLGLVTYNLAKDWNVETIIENCAATGFEGVELRTTHRHGVEIALAKAQRAEVKKRFADSRVRLVSLGTTCEYQSPDPAVVDTNVGLTRRWCELAQDLGCLGVKVRPNGFPKGVPEEKTLDQIGRALARCGDTARDHGVEIWLEVHGEGTQLPSNIQRIMQVADHPAVGVCWNSNDTDVANGSVKQSFQLLEPWLRNCHINELWRTDAPWPASLAMKPGEGTPGFPAWQKPYPWRELFSLLRTTGYSRYTLAEVPESCEPLRFMHYYRALWEYESA